MKVVVIIILNITLVLSLKTKHYKKQKISSFEIIKELTQPLSDMQCCSHCTNEMSCEGVQFDGTTCRELRNVKLNPEGIQDAWITTELTNTKMTKLLIINGQCYDHKHHMKTEVIDLEDPNNHCTTIDFPYDMCYTTGALIGADLPFFCGGSDYDNVPKTECYTLWKREYKQVTSLDHAKSGSFGNNIVISNVITF